MSKKDLDTQTVVNELKGQSVFFSREKSRGKPRENTRDKSLDNSREMPRDNSRDNARDNARDNSRGKSRGKPRNRSRDLPTRDEIQAFTFHLRDELKVKVQAEIPHQWQKELQRMARDLDVRKLELYRFIIGEFLGKVKRGGDSRDE